MAKDFFTVASFFSGAGGFDEGFKRKGFKIVFANDNWGDACKTFKLNHDDVVVFEKDIQELTKDEMKEAMIKKEVNEISVVIGGPPCQCFTRLNNEYLLKKKKDSRKELFKEYISKIEILQPKLVFMENVKDLLLRKNEEGEYYGELITDAFNKIGYVCYHDVLSIEKYRVPQNRKRVIFVATNDQKIIKKLNNSNLRFPKEHMRIPTTEQYLEKLTKFNNLENHEITKNSPEIKLKIKKIPQGGYYEHLPEHLKIKKNRKGKLVVVKRYGSYLRRLHPKKPALTITNNYIIHPTKHRFLTSREKAILHTFKPNYKFYGGMGSVSQQIANAVPPNFAEELAKHALFLLS